MIQVNNLIKKYDHEATKNELQGRELKELFFEMTEGRE